MEQFKRAKVIMLPTENKLQNGLQPYLNLKNNRLSIPLSGAEARRLSQVSNYQPQHLYIISDDEIKEGDWGLDLDDISIFKCESKYGKEFTGKLLNGNKRGLAEYSNCKKIIATRDTSLKTFITNSFIGRNCVPQYSYLPQPSQQFIEKYIKSYNKGKIITDILVEYERCKTCLDQNRIYDFKNKVKTHICSKCSFNNTHPIDNLGDDYCENYSLKINSKDNTITIRKLKDSWNKEEIIKLIEDYSVFDDGTVSTRNKWINNNL